MSHSKLILITGRPATGKTYLAQKVAESTHFPVISKDAIKEIMFDTLGIGDREWSIKLGRSTFALLDYIIETQLKAGNNVILESPLNPAFENEKFQKWQKTYNFDAVQIICNTDSDVLFKRFEKRAQSGERHEGHKDSESLDEFRATLAKEAGEQRIDIQSTVIEVDTTDLGAVDYGGILTQVHDAIL